MNQLFVDDAGETFDDFALNVVRTKQVELLPMDLEDALLQLELLGHDFYLYKDVADGAVNVLYKREEGGVGLLEVKAD